jgi:exopolysaccharide production protein ExoQ
LATALYTTALRAQTSPGRKPVMLERPGSQWRRTSTWVLLAVWVYYALNGVSPFVNEPTVMRAVATSSGESVAFERLSKLVLFLVCMAFVIRRRQSVRGMAGQMKLVTFFPLLALILFPVSQQATRSVTSALVLLSGILLMYSVVGAYTLDQILEQLLVLGTVTITGSIVFALALPQYGLDNMGGHASAWKGVFSAKNALGDMALFFLTAAVSYRPRTTSLRALRAWQVLACLVAIALSQAATAYMLTGVYVIYFAVMKCLHRFRKRDYVVLAAGMLTLFFAAAAAMILFRPDFVLSLLGKDATLTGRTQIWAAVLHSISQRPLFGYGYQAFWLGLEGESYHVILAVSWMLNQAQSGFLDVTVETGVGGLVIVLLVFFFAFRDALKCLFRSRDEARLNAVEWYLAVVLLTMLYNLDESFIFEPKHLGSMMFVLACAGLKQEWLRLQEGSLHAY